jgi:hypothetical protein
MQCRQRRQHIIDSVDDDRIVGGQQQGMLSAVASAVAVSVMLYAARGASAWSVVASATLAALLIATDVAWVTTAGAAAARCVAVSVRL